MTKITVIILAVVLPQFAFGGDQLKKYVEGNEGPNTGYSRTLATRTYTLPVPVFSEVLREIMSGRINIVLGYLSQAASNGNNMAKEMILIAVYYDTQSDQECEAELHRIKAGDRQISVRVPNLFCNVVESGFPQDSSKGWYDWFHQVNPHVENFGKKNNHEPRIWVLDITEKPVSEALKSLANQSGMTIHYTAPKSGDPTVTLNGADVPVSDAFRDIADVTHMKITFKGDEVFFTPKE